MRESYGTTVMDFIYDESGRPFALRYSSDSGSSFHTYYYVLNLQGDVVALYDPDAPTSSQAVVRYTYNAWGELLTATTTSTCTTPDLATINPLRYRGYYYDTETGWYYLQSRYYDPVTHRFINADTYTSTSQGFLGYNMYVYCLNNPVACADINGNYTYYVVNGVETKEVGVDGFGSVIYETTINYTYVTINYTYVTMNTNALFFPEVTIDGTVTYQYTVDNRGAISYDSRKNKGGELGDKAISTALAKEMYSTATNQVNGALSGRTIDGIAKELRRHTQFAFLGEKIGVADIGGLDKNKPDYDYNARMFENPWEAISVIFEMLFK